MAASFVIDYATSTPITCHRGVELANAAGAEYVCFLPMRMWISRSKESGWELSNWAMFRFRIHA